MSFGFHVIRKLDNGELLPVTWRADLDSAESLLRELSEFWPGVYWIEEAAGTGVPSARFAFPGNEMIH